MASTSEGHPDKSKEQQIDSQTTGQNPSHHNHLHMVSPIDQHKDNDDSDNSFEDLAKDD